MSWKKEEWARGLLPAELCAAIEQSILSTREAVISVFSAAIDCHTKASNFIHGKKWLVSEEAHKF